MVLDRSVGTTCPAAQNVKQILNESTCFRQLRNRDTHVSRERQRERDRERERDKERETTRERQRETERDRERDRVRERERDRESGLRHFFAV